MPARSVVVSSMVRTNRNKEKLLLHIDGPRTKVDWKTICKEGDCIISTDSDSGRYGYLCPGCTKHLMELFTTPSDVRVSSLQIMSHDDMGPMR